MVMVFVAMVVGAFPVLMVVLVIIVRVHVLACMFVIIVFFMRMV